MVQTSHTKRILALCLGLLALILTTSGCQPEAVGWRLGSGPRGGTFENLARTLASLLNANLPGNRVEVVPTGGSVDNLIAVQGGKLDLGLVFAGDAALGRNGQLRRELAPTTDVLALARLYGATAQLVVLHSSTLQSVQDLSGQRIAIGGIGTGAALAAERYFRSLGLWQTLIPIHLGYQIAIEDLKAGNLDAVWLQSGVPSEYLRRVAKKTRLRFLNLADQSSFRELLAAYPFYAPVTIPAGTYRGQDRPIGTFQDAALLVAGSGVDADFVYSVLRILFSDQGLQRLQSSLPAVHGLVSREGLKDVTIPLHPGAKRFWQELGRRLPPGLQG